MPAAIAALTESLARHAERKSPAAEAAANLFRAAGAQLEQLSTDATVSPDAWNDAIESWRSALATLTQAAVPGAGPLHLVLENITYRLPPVPGLDAGLRGIPSTGALDSLKGLRDDVGRRVSLGPITLEAIVPSVQARRAGHPAGEIIGLLPSSGLTIAVDAGPARGGGALSFSDTPHWRLAGAFGLSLGPVSVAAFGILERPGGGLSLLLLLSARFTPGIQLGFGFAISGVGGLIGVNRRADTDAIRGRLASGEATEALFADSPAANAPAILETLGQLFVAAPGSFVVGPTLQLTWLKLGELDFLRLDVGLFIEFPGPARIVIVGRALAEVPAPGMPLVHLQLDLVGEVDFAKSLVHIRAALVNSHALGIFRAAGDAVLAMCWGSPPYQVLSIGGFYPGFNPAPAILQPLRRISLTNDFDGLPGLSMRFEAYLAATTNTFQVGGRLDLGINIGISAEGHINLDALFQYRPFHFEIDISGELRVGVLGQTFTGVGVSGHLSGPGPIVLRAGISIDLWLDDFTWNETFTIGRSGGGAEAEISLIPALAAELVGANIRARDAADPHVAITPGPSAVPLVSPLSTLVFSQHIAPLNLRLERFGGLRLKEATTALVKPTDPAVTAGAIERAYFAPGTFLDLSTAEALNQPPFDRLDAGFELAFGTVRATPNKKDVGYINYYRGRPLPIAGVFQHFDAMVLGLMGARRKDASITNRDPLVVARDEAWVTRSGSGQAVPAASRTAAHVTVRTGGASIALPAADKPVSLAGVA